MPFMQIPPHERYYGIKSEGDGTDINADETPDSRNDDISQKGELNKRPGMTKNITTALSGGAIMDIGYLENEGGTKTQLAVVDDGTLQSFS